MKTLSKKLYETPEDQICYVMRNNKLFHKTRMRVEARAPRLGKSIVVPIVMEINDTMGDWICAV